MHENIDINKFVGQAIRQFRKDKLLTLNDMADKLAISYQQLQKYETGANRIAAYKLFELAKLMDTDVSNFFPSIITNGGMDKNQILVAHYYNQMKDDKLKRILLDLIRNLGGSENLAELKTV